MVKHAGHVQEHGEHHQVGSPSVHVSDQQTEGDRGLEVLNVVPGRRCFRAVEEHQEDASDCEQDEEEEAQTAEAECVADLHRMALHLDGVQVI